MEEYGALKRSALSKAMVINGFIGGVTLGPQSIRPHKIEKPQKKTETRGTNTNNKNDTNKISYSPFKQILAEFEQQRQNEVYEKIAMRKKRIELFNVGQVTSNKEDWSKRQMDIIHQVEQEEQEILKALKQLDIDSSKEHEKQKKIYQEWGERKKQNDRVIKEKQEKQRMVSETIMKLQKIQQDFSLLFMEIIETLKTCNEQVKVNLSECIKNINLLPAQMNDVLCKCKEGNVSDEDVVKYSDLLEFAKELQNEINMTVEMHNKAQQDALIDHQRQVEAEKVASEAALAATIQAKEVKHETIHTFVSKSNFKIYSELQDILQVHESSYKSLFDDANLKTFKFDCKKAINLPVNSISAVSSNHLTDKYNKLHRLLSGNEVDIGGSKICAGKHPLGIPFSMDLLAKKFVLQGDMLISSNPEAAYSYASVMVSLWNDFPLFGKLLLAHFHQQCPYLVPIYFPKVAEQTDEEYYKNLGYRYTDGVIEKQDKFLKRMTGIMRLYVAIMLVKPKMSQNTHPYDLSNGWKWLTGMLNMQPEMDISATLIFVFLESAGFVMQQTYSKQFNKLIQLITENFLGLMKQCDSGGPVARLEGLLDNFKKTRQFEKPTGTLPPNFW